MYPAGAVVGAAPAAAPNAASRVDKATSHLLMGPDWAVNLEICDIINADVWQTKDVVKAVKKRLQNKDPKLLETMMKNCGEYVQFEVSEQHVLQEMVKIIQKKNDMRVRDKILLLLDSWQEAFGGPGSKYPQYHWAYLEVKLSIPRTLNQLSKRESEQTTGVVFPRRPIDAPPIFTPPATHNSQTYGSPRYVAGSLNDRMSSDVETLSLGDLNKIRNVTDLLNDMVHALNPSDRMAVNDEIITDLVTQCRSNQQKLLQFVSSTGNEQLLKQGLEINDLLQSVLSKYDAMATGTPLAVEAPARETVEVPREAPAVKPSAPPEHINVADEEEDEFAQLAQRKNKSVVSSDDASSSTGDLALVPIDPAGSESSSSAASNALVPLDPAPSSSTESKELDMIDLLSLTLCSPTPETSTDSSTQNQNEPQQPTVTNGHQYPSAVKQYPSNYPQTTNQVYTPQNSNYVSTWAHTGAYPSQPPAYASGYQAAPWASTPATVDSNPFLSAAYQEPLHSPVASTAQTTTYAPLPVSYASPVPYGPPATSQPIQHYNSVDYPPTNGLTATQAQMNGNQQPKASSAVANKPYYIPGNLFSDLIDLKGFSGGNKMGGPTSMGSSNGGQPMIGGKK
ncbi:TOM1-like protein 6 isoform X2 [Phragmites australis]|uniref:TOM1-like protein 6 isoform X2 n=1 Tax=Phragmites australis TaxID=29695 RepID=UPI002D7804B6|nr:TOM1-like protein 6 isoform X2 [Phragmites australis]